MRRRRIRSTRRSKGGAGWNALIVVLLLAVVAVYAVLAMERWKGENGGSSALPTATAAATMAATDEPSASPSGAAGTGKADNTAASGKVTETITLKSITLYGVQLGVFSEQGNATQAATGFRAKGAAGYVLKEDGMYRVLDSVYYQQSDAKAVRDAYKAQDQSSACLYNVATAGIQWNVSGSQVQIDAIKAAVAAFQAEIVTLINTQKQADAGGDTATIVAAIRASAGRFSSANEELAKAVGDTKSVVIASLMDCQKTAADNLTKLADGNATNAVALRTGLKYNVIDILLTLENDVLKVK